MKVILYWVNKKRRRTKKMKNFKTKATAVALTALMTTSVIGATSASAVTMGTTDKENNTRTVYFINNKEWNDVYGYVWGEAGDITKSFPGEELEPLGTTTELGTAYEVYSMTVKVDEVKGILFDAGAEHREQTPSIVLDKTPVNCFYLSLDNHLLPCKDFQPSEIVTVAPAKASRAISVEDKEVGYIGETAPLQSMGNKSLFINAQLMGRQTPTVTFVRTGGSTVGATSVKPMTYTNGYPIDGMYEVEVPAGSFTAVHIQFGNVTLESEVNDATDSVKIDVASNYAVKAIPCQRIQFNNNLSNMNDKTQEVRAYAWNSVADAEEKSFDRADKMTRLYEDQFGVDVYCYDVPLTCDSIVFFTTDANTAAVTAKTQDVKLGLTTNTLYEVVMDGYYVSNTANTMSQEVSNYNDQVTR